MTTRGRVILAALAAAALIVGGVATWRILDQAGHSTTIPASFDGQWHGTDPYGGPLTATLVKDLKLGQLRSDNSCFVGKLTVVDATDSRLETRFAPVGTEGCNPWTVVFTHLPGGDLKMAVDPDSSFNYEQEFEVRMTRQG